MLQSTLERSDRPLQWLDERLILPVASTQLSIVTVNLESAGELGVDWDGVGKAFAAVGRRVRTADANSRPTIRFVTLTRETRDCTQPACSPAFCNRCFQKVGTPESVN